MNRAYVSIGSNVEPQRHVCRAAGLLREAFGRVEFSPVYRNPAVGFAGDDFLNLAAAFDTTLEPHRLVERLHAIEAACGRERGLEKFAPRTLDLDLLLHGDLVLDGPELVLPRPEILRQAFVLRPLAELAPDLVHPVVRRPLRALWEAFEGRREGLERVELDCLSA